MTELRAATIYQPFADLIVAGVKDVENRSRPPTWWNLPEWQRCTKCGCRASPYESTTTFPVACGANPPVSVSHPIAGHRTEPDGPYPFRLANHAAKKVEWPKSEDAEGELAWRAWADLNGYEEDPWAHYFVLDQLVAGERRGVILGTVEVTGSHHADECADRVHHPAGYGYQFCSRWAEPDRHHWTLADPRPLDDPIPATGQQGLWRLDDDVVEQLILADVPVVYTHGRTHHSRG